MSSVEALSRAGTTRPGVRLISAVAVVRDIIDPATVPGTDLCEPGRSTGSSGGSIVVDLRVEEGWASYRAERIDSLYRGPEWEPSG